MEMDNNKEKKMTTDLEKDGVFEGFWWLPENPNEKIAGIAKYDKKQHILLKLFGIFSSLSGSKNTTSIPVIVGQFSSEKLSLLGCSGSISFKIENSDVFTGYSVYKCDEFIEGYHVKDLTNFKVVRVDMSFTNLSHWLNSRFNNNETGIESDNLKKESDYLLKDEVEIGDGLKIEFISHLNSNSHNFIRTNSEVNSFISLYHAEGKSLLYFKKIISKLQTLLSFAMQEQAYQKDIKIFPNDSEFVKDSFLLYNDIKAKYVYQLRGDFNECKETLGQNMLFNFSLIKENLNDILNKWIFDSEKYGLAFELYFSILFNKEMYLEHKFLSYVQAIEGLLRIFQEEAVYMDRVEFRKKLCKPLKANLPEDLDEDLKKKIMSEFPRLNEFGLRKRFDLFLREFSDDFKKVLFIGLDESKFSSEIALIRNYLSHLFTSEPDCYKNKDVFNKYTSKLEILLAILLFKVIGLPQNKIEEIIQRRM